MLSSGINCSFTSSSSLVTACSLFAPQCETGRNIPPCQEACHGRLQFLLSCNWPIFCHNKWVEINLLYYDSVFITLHIVIITLSH